MSDPEALSKIRDAIELAQEALSDIANAAEDLMPSAYPNPGEKAEPPRIQTSVRLDPAMWAALKNLASRKRVEDGWRVTVHDLLIEGARHILAGHGAKRIKA